MHYLLTALLDDNFCLSVPLCCKLLLPHQMIILNENTSSCWLSLEPIRFNAYSHQCYSFGNLASYHLPFLTLFRTLYCYATNYVVCNLIYVKKVTLLYLQTVPRSIEEELQSAYVQSEQWVVFLFVFLKLCFSVIWLYESCHDCYTSMKIVLYEPLHL